MNFQFGGQFLVDFSFEKIKIFLMKRIVQLDFESVTRLVRSSYLDVSMVIHDHCSIVTSNG